MAKRVACSEVALVADVKNAAMAARVVSFAALADATPRHYSLTDSDHS